MISICALFCGPIWWAGKMAGCKETQKLSNQSVSGVKDKKHSTL